MRWLTPIILIVVLLTAACGNDPGGKDKIAVIDWDKAVSAHPQQTSLKQGEAELQKLLRYREEQAEMAKTQIAGLTRLQQLKQNSKANFLDADFQTQMYAAEAKERQKLLEAYELVVKEADAALAEQEKELEDAYQLKILNLRLRLDAIKMLTQRTRGGPKCELNQVQSEARTATTAGSGGKEQDHRREDGTAGSGYPSQTTTACGAGTSGVAGRYVGISIQRSGRPG